MIGMGPIGDGLGLMHPVTSYVNELVIAVTSCREMLPDPAVYAQCLQDSHDELAEATAARTRPRSDAPRRTAASRPSAPRRRSRARSAAERSKLLTSPWQRRDEAPRRVSGPLRRPTGDGVA